jgi:DnaJ like chaperone protein
MTLAEVKRAYRRLAMKHHPDRVQADGLPPELLEAAEARFKDIQNAFDAVEKALKPA